MLVYEEARSRSVSKDNNGSPNGSRTSSRGSHSLPHYLLRDNGSAHAGSSDPSNPSVPDPASDEDDVLGPWSILAFSLGHFQNDAFSSLWFTYLLLYLEGTLDLPPRLSAIVLLTGQVFDALATPVAGLISDAGEGKVYRLGGAEWHLCPR